MSPPLPDPEPASAYPGDTPAAGDPRHEPLPAAAPAAPHAVRTWFDALTEADLPAPDGTLATARRAADALARRAKAANTRRAYRAAVRAWCDWCARHDLPALPATPADIAAFLAEARHPAPPAAPLGVNTVRLRAAAIRYLHVLARLPSPTASAEVG